MIKDFFLFIKERKKWWIAPIVIMLLFVGMFIVLSSSPAITPFIYTLF